MTEEAEPRYTMKGAGQSRPSLISSFVTELLDFVREVWLDLRPYLTKLIVDFCISAGLWVALYLFELLTKLLEIGGWAGELIVNIHAVGIVLAFIAFGLLFCLDVWLVRTEKSRYAEAKSRAT